MPDGHLCPARLGNDGCTTVPSLARAVALIIAWTLRAHGR